MITALIIVSLLAVFFFLMAIHNRNNADKWQGKYYNLLSGQINKQKRDMPPSSSAKGFGIIED